MGGEIALRFTRKKYVFVANAYCLFWRFLKLLILANFFRKKRDRNEEFCPIIL